jgi:sulfur carrier protein
VTRAAPSPATGRGRARGAARPATTMARLLVNGTETAFREGESLRDLLQRLGFDPEQRGVALAVNDAVVPRSAWATHLLAPDDRVDLLHAVQGG